MRNFLVEIAHRKVDGRAGWLPTLLTVVTGGFIVTGAVPVGTYKSGPRKGDRKFPPDSARDRVLVSDAEVHAEEDKYEQATGKCCRCDGGGKDWVGWSEKDGTTKRYAPCRRCDGTGKRPNDGSRTETRDQ